MRSSELGGVLRDALTERLAEGGWTPVASEGDLVASSARSHRGSDRRCRAAEELLPEGIHELELRTADQVREVAARICGLVLARGTDFASEYRTVDDLLSEPKGKLRTVALLAAAGRFDAAASALEAWTPGPEDDHSERVLARRLRRYIDARGDPALIPAEPPPDRFDSMRPTRPSVGELWRQGRARDAAVKAVAAAPRETPREELRRMMAAELSARSVHGDPIWIVFTLP